MKGTGPGEWGISSCRSSITTKGHDPAARSTRAWKTPTRHDFVSDKDEMKVQTQKPRLSKSSTECSIDQRLWVQIPLVATFSLAYS
jgi:hypothetical protein